MSDDPRDKGARTGAKPTKLTPDEREQGEQSLALLERLFDESDDEETEEDGPVTARDVRLAAAARWMVDDLGRRMAEGRPLTIDERGAPGARKPSTVDDAELDELLGGDGADRDDRAPVAPHDPDTVDTARIVALGRDALLRLVERLSRLRGESPPESYDQMSLEELRAEARRLRTPAAHP